jgi:hypothetical protein
MVLEKVDPRSQLVTLWCLFFSRHLKKKGDVLLWFFSILKRFRLRVASSDHFLSSEPSLYFLPHEICYALPIQPEIESIGRWDTAHQNSSPRVPPGWCSLSVSVEPTSRWVTQALFLLPNQVHRIRWRYHHCEISQGSRYRSSQPSNFLWHGC